MRMMGNFCAMANKRRRRKKREGGGGDEVAANSAEMAAKHYAKRRIVGPGNSGKKTPN